MATRGGVERFDVTVDKGSWLSTLSSTNNALRLVNVESAGNKGQLFIGDSMETGKAMMEWQDAPKLLSSTGLTDVKWFIATDYDGEINIGAQLTSASYDKYTKDVDGLKTVADGAPSGDFTYTLGSNDDTINMVVNGGLAADRDFKLVINGEGGDDFINFSFDANITTNEIENIRNLKNVVLNGGAGNDTVKFWGDGAVTVNGGAGQDVIYVGQTTAEHSGDHNAVFVLNTGNAAFDRAIYWDQTDGAQPLDNNLLSTTNSFTYTSTGAGTVYLNVIYEGILSRVEVGKTTATALTGTITADALNKLVIKAIEDSPALNAIFSAKDGAGQSLIIESLIDGIMGVDAAGLTGLGITFTGDVTAGNIAGTVVTGYAASLNHATESDVLGVVTVQNGVAAIENFDQATGQPLLFDVAAGDFLAIKIGNEMYYSQAAAAGNTDTNVMDALMTARTAGGKLLVNSYTVDDDGAGNNGAFTITAKGGASLGDVAMYNIGDGLTNKDAVGTDEGTYSYSTVNAGADNDIIVLNAENGVLPGFDTLVIDAAFGNDTIFNYTPGEDQINVRGLLGDLTAAAFNNTTGNANSASIVTTANAAAANNIFTVAEAVAALQTLHNSTVAGQKSLVFLLDGTASADNPNDSVYTVFQITSDASATLSAGEVQLMGSMTFEHGTILTNADLVV